MHQRLASKGLPFVVGAPIAAPLQATLKGTRWPDKMFWANNVSTVKRITVNFINCIYILEGNFPALVRANDAFDAVGVANANFPNHKDRLEWVKKSIVPVAS